jgi:hypothetical protein
MARKKRKKPSATIFIIIGIVLLVAGIVVLKLLPQPTKPFQRLPVAKKLIPQTLSKIPKIKRPRPSLPKLPHPRVAILIDDLGWNIAIAQSLIQMDFPLTFSILPSLPYSIRIAELAANHHREVLLHLPMEPYGYTNTQKDQEVLLTTMEREVLEKITRTYLEKVPHIIGVNNHMGSKFTENPEKMKIILQILGEKGLFFIDSRTSKNSVGYQTAKELGLKAGQRKIFLDNQPTEDYIIQQLTKLEKLAREDLNNGIIAIAHPHPSTIAALGKVLPKLKASGIEIVPVSELIN